MDFKIGDVVRLKSGGYEMTVAQYPFKTMDGVEHPEKLNASGLMGITILNMKCSISTKSKSYELLACDLEI